MSQELAASDPEVTTTVRNASSIITPGRTALLAAILAFIPYLLTLNPTFGFIDKGELVAVATTFGISHPTGYPTIMALGYIFTHLVPLRPVYALNLMAALLTAASAGGLTLLFDDLLRRFTTLVTVRARGKGEQQKGKKKNANPRTEPERQTLIDPQTRAILAGLGALILVFTGIWWDQGNGFEVYSLHAFMLPIVTLLFLRYIDEEAAREGEILPGSSVTAPPTGAVGFTRRGFFFALALGLSFSNHLTTILLAPAFLVYYFWMFLPRSNGNVWKRLLFLTPPFLLGLSPYILLPIRASMHPYFNWGDPETPKRFMDHVMGWQYQSWMKLDSKVFDQQTSYFLHHLPQQVAYVGLALAVLGVIQIARRNAKLSVFVALLLIACIGYAGSFEIMEIMPYYMVAIFAIGIWCVAGLAWLYERLGSRPAILIGLLMAVATCAVNYHDSDESKNVLVEDMTLNMLRTLPPNALVLSSQWDFWLAGSWYMQVVEKMRPDVLVVDPELLRRSWYLDELEHNHPEFMAKVKPEVDRFRPELYKFEHGLDYVSAEIDGAYTGMIDAMIAKNIDSRPVHITGEIDPGMSARYQRVPYYLTMRLMKDTVYIPMEFPKYQFHFWEGRVDPYAAKLYELYARSVQGRMIYEGQHGNDALAKRYAAYLLSFDPHYSLDDVPDAPLNGEDQITGVIGYFNEMRSKLEPILNQK